MAGHELNLKAADSSQYAQAARSWGDPGGPGIPRPAAFKKFSRIDEPLPAMPSYIRPQPAREGNRARKALRKR
jgi:hypothetical protein